MFSLFGKKEATIKVKDKVWMTGEAKLHAFMNEWRKKPEVVFVFWFDESLRQVEYFLQDRQPQPRYYYLPGKQIHFF